MGTSNLLLLAEVSLTFEIIGSVTAPEMAGSRSLLASSAVQSWAEHFTQSSVNRKNAVSQRNFLVKKLHLILGIFVLGLFKIMGNSKFRIKCMQKTYPAEDAVSFQFGRLLRNY